MNEMVGWLRGFFIALAILIGLPLALVLLALTIPEIAVVYAYVIAPQIAFIYPAFLFSDFREQATNLSLVQALLFAAAFGWAVRYRKGGAQFGWALLVVIAWWLAWRLAGMAFDLHPDFDVRM
jgi:hypothetical protein